MSQEIQDSYYDTALKSLLEQEADLEAEAAGLSAKDGMVDIDVNLELIRVRFKTALLILEALANQRRNEKTAKWRDLPGSKTRAGVSLLEELLEAEIPESQQTEIRKSELYNHVKTLFQEIILAGGAGFFDQETEDRKKNRLVARTVAEAIRKYAPPDDEYGRLVKSETLRPSLRRFMAIFFPTLAPENPGEPPFGIEEGEERVYKSKKMRMPLSQVIDYLETALIPELESKLIDSPGDPELQRQKTAMERRLEEYRRLRFFPRSTPVLLEKNFYTDGLSGYTADGELMLTINLPVEIRSGTNLSRTQELVISEVTRQLAGKGVNPDFDKQYGELKKLASGIKGSSRLPSFKINTKREFRLLKDNFPTLRRLEDKVQMKKWLQLAKSGKRRALNRELLQATRKKGLPPLELP